MTDMQMQLRPIGRIRSDLQQLKDAPRQGDEGAPDAWLDLDPHYLPALAGVAPGAELVVITWLDRANRELLQVHPRDNLNAPLAGVFGTRSSDRPNPLGLHHVVLKELAGNALRIGPIEAIDGTPVVDIKPVLVAVAQR